MSIFGLPLILFKVEAEDVGDLEFLRDKQVAGNLLKATATDDAPSPITIASITPANGKTFFISDSYITVVNQGGASDNAIAELQNDGVTVDLKRCRLFNNTSFSFGHGAIKSDSLIGDGVKVYRIQKTLGLSGFSVIATIQGWIEDT